MIAYEPEYITSHRHLYGFPRIRELEAGLWLISSIDTRVGTRVGLGIGDRIAHVRNLKEQDSEMKYMIY
jgi:predicted glycoside hydrolase/deacetylase ChbG (UPF0249 family)